LTLLFRDKVIYLVKQIPLGSVATYGQIAALAGSPRAARQVGGALRGLKDHNRDIPWQRVVNRQGGISTWKTGAGELQLALLNAEGVDFNSEGYCSLNKYLWQVEPHLLAEYSNLDV